MKEEWKEEYKDDVSGRKIFGREVPVVRSGYYGTYDFKIEREFQVRAPNGDVLFQASDSAGGEYWCGVFLFFVDGSNGQQVRLQTSDRDEDEFYDVPDAPLLKDKVRQ